MRAIKNNAENAIKPQRTIMRQRQQAPASVFCKDQAARQSARDSIFDGSSFAACPLLHAGRAAMVAFNGARYSHIRILEGDAVNR